MGEGPESSDSSDVFTLLCFGKALIRPFSLQEGGKNALWS
jgi:hypothetical protein